MHADSLLIAFTLGIVLAFFFGFIAHKIRLSPLVGYLIAGMIVGPFTPGFVADQDLLQLAELGVILLMFGVGLHFSFDDLVAVKAIAIPGAIVQMFIATVLGYAVATYWGLPLLEGLLFGFSLSVASTVVLLRSLEEREEINTEKGHIAVGWLITEDIAIIIALVLLPVLTATTDFSSTSDVLLKICLTILKVCTFISVMLICGKRLLPRLLQQMEQAKSQELFSLGVLTIALGVAYAAYKLFDASFALGAFFAGLVINNTNLSHKVLQHLLPLRDTFSVLFFVSVGMLFDPSILMQEPLAIIAIVSIIIIGKSAAALLITTYYRCPLETGLTIAVSLAQIGEFSFVFSKLALGLGLISAQTNKFIIAAAIISIALNPLLFKISDFIAKYQKK